MADRLLLTLLVMVYVVAVFWPIPGRAIRSATLFSFPVPFLLLSILLVVAGLAIEGEQIGATFRRRWLILAGQVALWGAPLALVLLLGVFHGAWPVGLMCGIALVALMPTAASSVAWSQLSGGNVTVSLGLLAVSTLLSPFVIASAGSLGIAALRPGSSSAASSPLFGLLVWIIPAFLAGGVLRWWLGRDRIAAARPYLKLVSVTVLLLLNYANAALALPQIAANPDWATLATVGAVTVSICGSGFLAGWLVTHVSKVERATRSAFVFGLGMKNTGMALVLAGIWLESQPLATLAVILYTLTQHLMAATYHQRTL